MQSVGIGIVSLLYTSMDIIVRLLSRGALIHEGDEVIFTMITACMIFEK